MLGGGLGGCRVSRKHPHGSLASPSAVSRKAGPSPRHPLQPCSGMAQSPLGVRAVTAQGAARRSLGNDRPPAQAAGKDTGVRVLPGPGRAPRRGVRARRLLLSPFGDLSLRPPRGWAAAGLPSAAVRGPAPSPPVPSAVVWTVPGGRSQRAAGAPRTVSGFGFLAEANAQHHPSIFPGTWSER